MKIIQIWVKAVRLRQLRAQILPYNRWSVDYDDGNFGNIPIFQFLPLYRQDTLMVIQQCIMVCLKAAEEIWHDTWYAY